MNLQFQHKEYIWLLIGAALLVLLFFALLQWKKKTIKKIGDERLVKALTSSYSPRKFGLKFLLLLIAAIAGIAAVMNLRKPGEDAGASRKGIDVAIALDVSKSMLAADMAPNRLERAKQFIAKLMDEMPNDRIALVLFAGKAYLQMPLTIDHGAAKMFVASASPEAVPQQGTVISDALTMSVNAFDAADKKFKTIIIITDGEDHDDGSLSTARELSGQGVMINTIGIGSPEGSTLPDIVAGENKKDAAGNVIISKLNESILQQLAAETNGVYVRLQGSDEAVTTIKSQLSQIDKKAFNDTSQLNYKTFFAWFAGLLFLLLVAELFITERRKEKTAGRIAV